MQERLRRIQPTLLWQLHAKVGFELRGDERGTVIYVNTCTFVLAGEDEKISSQIYFFSQCLHLARRARDNGPGSPHSSLLSWEWKLCRLQWLHLRHVFLHVISCRKQACMRNRCQRYEISLRRSETCSAKKFFLEYRVIFLSCLIKNSYCGQENKARSLREPAFESPMSDVYSYVFVEN